MKIKIVFLLLTFLFLSTSEAQFVKQVSSSPVVENGGSGCDDNNCIWLTGKNFKASNLVSIYIPNTFFSLATYEVDFTPNYQNTGKDLITFRITSTSVQEIFASQGVNVRVLDNQTNQRSNFFNVKKQLTPPPPPPSACTNPPPQVVINTCQEVGYPANYVGSYVSRRQFDCVTQTYSDWQREDTCKPNDIILPPPPPTPPVVSSGWQTKYVGFYASALYGVGSGNYIQEVSQVSNLVLIGSTDPDLISKLQQAKDLNMKVLVSTRWSFFDGNGDIVSNHMQNWANLKQRLDPFRAIIIGFYLADEPYWNYQLGHPNPDQRHYDWVRDWLNHLSRVIKIDWPETITAFVEAYPIFTEGHFLNPELVDWIGMDCYDSFDSCNGKSIPWYYEQIKKTMHSHQKLIAVPGVGKPVGSGKTEVQILSDLKKFDEMAKTDSSFIMTMPFLWQSFGTPSEGWHGARDLSSVKEELVKRGKP